VNPVIDEHNRTADLAVELALSAFWKEDSVTTLSSSRQTFIAGNPNGN